MQTDMREKQLNIRLSDDEAARLDRLADHFGINSAAVIRMLLRDKERELGLAPANAPPAKKAARTKR